LKRKWVEMRAKFIRGRDPKEAMGIGEWHKGYRVDNEMEYEIHIGSPGNTGYHRIDLNNKEWNMGRKIGNAEDVPETKVTSEMALKIDHLPVITFRHYYTGGGNEIGMFGDWPEDFPYIRTPFIASVIDYDDKTYLIEPEGYYYPRYITELV
jgi:hypothetical protein